MDSGDDLLAFEGEQVFRDGDDGEFLPPTPQEIIEYMEAEVLRLRAEVELRQEAWDYWNALKGMSRNSRAHLKHLAATRELEIQRLREEVERLDRQASGVQALGRLNANLTEERDALAEALREVLTSLAAFSLNVNLSASLNAAKDSGWVVLARAGRTDG